MFDYVPKSLSEEQIFTLQKLGAAVTKLLIGKRKNIQAEYFQQIFNISNNLICVLDNQFILKDINPVFEETFQIDKNKAIDLNFLSLLGKQNSEVDIEQFIQNGEELVFTTTTRMSDHDRIIIEWSLKRDQSRSEIFCFGINITQHTEENYNWKVLSAALEAFLKMLLA
jgi:PAS domain S-box-containing protein